MDILQSVAIEISLWETFAGARGANATVFLATVVAVWLAARFSSVSVDKDVNTLARVIVSVFALGVFAMWLNLGDVVGNTFAGHAEALSALDAANGDIDIGPGSQAFIQSVSEGNPVGMFGFWAVSLGGLLIALLPLWVNSSK